MPELSNNTQDNMTSFSLMESAGMPVAADRFGVSEPFDPTLAAYLSGAEISPGEVRDQLTGERFYQVLMATIDMEDETDATRAVVRFVEAAVVEFSEPDSTEELTALADEVEIQISVFIEGGGPSTSLRRIDLAELRQITAIYNPNNLLALAKDFLAVSGGTLDEQQMAMLYRYRVMLKLLAVTEQRLDQAQNVTSTKENFPGVSAALAFAMQAEVDDNAVRDHVTVDGVEVDIRRLRKI